MEILIRNGIVYDPLNKINGEVLDIGVKNGRIVDPSKLSKDALVIDASNKVVMPGAIDVHSHIAGPKVSVGRLIMPQDHYMTNIPGDRVVVRAQTGKAVPNVFKIGYAYAQMGYTLVVEPATPALETRHTHEELNAIPMLDKLALLLVDSNWLVLDYIYNEDIERLSAYFAWLLYATKAYGLKLVDPGSDYAWIYGEESLDLDDPMPKYGITPRDIIYSLGLSANKLNLPHKIHVHCNRLGYPGNYITTINTMKLGGKIGGEHALHVTHTQFTGYAGDSWYNLRSGSEEIIKEFNRNRRVTIDIGQVILNYTAVTMTADAPFENILYHLTKWKWSFGDVEAETASGIVPYRYRRKNYVNTIQWVIGLELMLLARDVWRIFMTTDHPNAGPFTSYPKIIAWLMSRKARDDEMSKVNRRGLSRSVLPSIDREYTLYEIAIVTRASPAKLLGLDNERGHLGIGARADIAIYNLNPYTESFDRDYEKILKAFRYASYVIKDGEIVVRDGRIIKTVYGSTYYLKPEIPNDIAKDVYKDVREKFKKYYSINPENYFINKSEIRNPIEVSFYTDIR